MSDTLLETGHSSSVTDMAVDASGRRMATASNDGAIHIYECTTHKDGARPRNEQGTSSWTHTSTLQCCEASSATSDAPSIHCIAWAPPAFYGAALIACTEQGNEVALWSDVASEGAYKSVYSHALLSPGWCVAWAPPEYGKMFAVGCADGAVVVFTGGPDGSWDVQAFPAHEDGGCSGISFAPLFPPGALLMSPLESEVGNDRANARPVPISPPRLITCGGRSRSVTLWAHSFEAPPAGAPPPSAPPRSVWLPMELEAPFTAPVVWREVCWAPNLGLPFTYVAAGTEDGQVVVWVHDGPASNPWHARELCPPSGQSGICVTKLSWSMVGTFLLVSYADGTALMWKESANRGEWVVVSELEDPTLST